MALLQVHMVNSISENRVSTLSRNSRIPKRHYGTIESLIGVNSVAVDTFITSKKCFWGCVFQLGVFTHSFVSVWSQHIALSADGTGENRSDSLALSLSVSSSRLEPGQDADFRLEPLGADGGAPSALEFKPAASSRVFHTASARESSPTLFHTDGYLVPVFVACAAGRWALEGALRAVGPEAVEIFRPGRLPRIRT